ncbi:conserved hypothetical protein [Lebetimonas natsushimae]|uniref:Uncharacterized protein n=1 Tax=Lebetimonas natsushimae TaxID=1936991 RepID=A0A292YFJ3_9BACT|nr:hypothetical protein [Lebetimonas natsushimae]GAX87883.1 conserved hypothetical protein [Lebetimonas natsushimae]
MKKLLLVLISIYLFAFNLNQNYKCETLGFSFKKDGKIYNVPNDVKTNKQLQKDLGKLYKISFIPVKNAIKLTVGDKNDTLPYIQTIKNKLDVYVTRDRQVIVFLDKNVSQVAVKIPSQQMVIFYQCK